MDAEKIKQDILIKKLLKKQSELEKISKLFNKLSFEVDSYQKDNEAYQNSIIEMQQKVTDFQKQYTDLIEKEQTVGTLGKKDGADGKKRVLIINSSNVVKAKAKKIFNKDIELFFASSQEEAIQIQKENQITTIIADFEHLEELGNILN